MYWWFKKKVIFIIYLICSFYITQLVKDCRSESELSDESNQITKLNSIHETKCHNNYHHTNQTSLKSNDVSINNDSNITTTNNNNISDIISDDNKLNHVFQRSNHCMQ